VQIGGLSEELFDGSSANLRVGIVDPLANGDMAASLLCHVRLFDFRPWGPDPVMGHFSRCGVLR
jgi:hypothetical protein